MSRIETYVFLHLGTTGPIYNVAEVWMPDVTELSMLAIKRTALLICKPTKEPRVQNKFQMFFNPPESIQEDMAEYTGLSDTLLEKEARFDQKAFKAIDSFIDCLEKPVCLIAHHGFLYHFPILKYNLEKINVRLGSDIKCTDSLQVFFDLIIKEEYTTDKSNLVISEGGSFPLLMNETAGKIGKEKPYVKIVRNPYYAPDVRPRESYTLDDIYKRRIKNGKMGKKNKTAEDYCFMMMKIAQSLKGFENWVQNNHCLFSEIPIYPTFGKTYCLDDNDDGPEDTEVKDSSFGQQEVEESSSEQKKDNSSSRWYNIFNYF